LIVVSAGLAAFSPTEAWRKGDTTVERCGAEFEAIDMSVRTAGVQDAEYARIEGFPYFRISRFLSDFEFSKLKPAERTEWIDLLVAADQAARTIEIGNLPATQRGMLYARLGRDPLQVLSDCADTLRKFDHEHVEAHEALPKRAEVGVSDQVPGRTDDWTDQELAALTAPKQDMASGPLTTAFEPVAGAPILASAAKVLIERSRTEQLAIPQPDEEVEERLVAGFAPVFIVTGPPDDAMVIPSWEEGKPEGEEYQAAAYTRLSHVKWKGRILLQVNYFVFFNDDPLDGLIWRVTVAPDGHPLAYDAVRTDGSDYLLVVPGKGLQASGRFARLTDTPDGERLAVTIDGKTRKVTHVGAWDGTTRGAYVLEDYNRLRRLYFHAGETRSLFGPEGVLNEDKPGSPRQWGHHRLATGTYFDAPDILDRLTVGSGS
jgi:hypothetical protein